MKKIKTALISVSDKKNLKPLLRVLKKNKVEKKLIPEMPREKIHTT